MSSSKPDMCCWLVSGVLATLLVASLAAAGPPLKSYQGNTFNLLSRLQNIKKQQMCDIFCSAGDWCPVGCPQYTLFQSFPSENKMKRGSVPYIENGPGELSFEDYMFLRLFGRHQRR